MPPIDQLPAPSLQEHGVLMRLYAATQTRCSAHISAQHAEIQRLQAQVLQLRARSIVRETALDWERQARQALQQQLEAQQALHAHLLPMARAVPPQPDLPTLSERATELLICQTGCVEHEDHWRADDRCKRTGKACVLALQPDALALLHAQPATNADNAPDNKAASQQRTMPAMPQR